MCIFCQIVEGKIPSKKIYEDKHTFVFLDISNHYYGHTLVIPKKHIPGLNDADAKTLAHTMATIKKVTHHYKKLGYDINLIQNNGENAGQQVFHLHFHIIPRTAKDKGPFEYFAKLTQPRNLDTEQKFFTMV